MQKQKIHMGVLLIALILSIALCIPVNAEENEEQNIYDTTFVINTDIEAQNILDRAYSWLDREAYYVWGGCSDAHFDCSGFVSYCLNGYYERVGTAASLMSMGSAVDYPQPGDVVTSGKHTGIYIGDGMMIDCSENRGNRAVRIHGVPSGYVFRRIRLHNSYGTLSSIGDFKQFDPSWSAVSVANGTMSTNGNIPCVVADIINKQPHVMTSWLKNNGYITDQIINETGINDLLTAYGCQNTLDDDVLEGDISSFLKRIRQGYCGLIKLNDTWYVVEGYKIDKSKNDLYYIVSTNDESTWQSADYFKNITKLINTNRKTTVSEIIEEKIDAPTYTVDQQENDITIYIDNNPAIDYYVIYQVNNVGNINVTKLDKNQTIYKTTLDSFGEYDFKIVGLKYNELNNSTISSDISKTTHISIKTTEQLIVDNVTDMINNTSISSDTLLNQIINT